MISVGVFEGIRSGEQELDAIDYDANKNAYVNLTFVCFFYNNDRDIFSI